MSSKEQLSYVCNWTEQLGGPDVLKRVALPEPHPLPGQVRVKVRAAGINPVDIMVRDGSLAGWFAGAQLPFVPGITDSGMLMCTAYCLLLTAYCLLLTAYCLLLTAYCLQ